MNKKSLLIVIFLLLILPLAVLLTKQRQEIRKKAATNDISVFLSSTSVAPGGNTSGGINVVAGTTAVTAVRANLVYDSSKATVTDFRCGSGLNQSDYDGTPGNLKVLCSKTPGFLNTTFTAATFTVTAGTSTGEVAFNLGSSLITDNNGDTLTSNKIGNNLSISSAVDGGSTVFFSFDSSAISPGGSTSGVVKINSGTTLVRTARIVVSYDATKINLTNLACASSFSNQTGLENRSGEAEIICSSSTGVSNSTNDIASFNIQALSGAAVGSTAINFVSTSRLTGSMSADVSAAFTNSTLQITAGGATATPVAGGITVSPSCVTPGGSVTISGSGFGTEAGAVHMTTPDVLGYCSKYSCGVNIGSTSWSNTQIGVTIPAGTSSGVKALGIFKQGAGDTDYLKPAPQVNVSNNCATPTPTATPTRAPTPTPTITVDPNRPASFTLSPSSTTVGTTPISVEIILNSGTKKVNSAQAVIMVDSKLSLVDASGTPVTEIIPGNTSLSNVLTNSYASNKIVYAAGKASQSTAAAAINGTLAKFYVKTTQTTGTATLSFKTGSTPDDSTVLDENAAYILGNTQSLTLNLGSGCGQGNSITAGTLTKDSEGRYHVPLTLCANPAPALTVGTETASYLVKIIGAPETATAADIKSYLANKDNCSDDLPTGGKVYCATTFANSVDYIFNPGATGARKLWVIYHNDATHSAASYWEVENTAWTNPIASSVINIPDAGNTLTFKLKMYAIDKKPTTPSKPAGLDYTHEEARVTIKSGDTVIYSYPAILTAGEGGVYTSTPVVLEDMTTVPFGSFKAGTYKLYVKPNYHFQKRFTGKALPSAEVIDLTAANYKFEAGDTNNDGVINLMDVNNVINLWKKEQAYKDQYGSDKTNLTAEEYRQIDFDRNGFINSGDTAAIFETMKTRYDDE